MRKDALFFVVKLTEQAASIQRHITAYINIYIINLNKALSGPNWTNKTWNWLCIHDSQLWKTMSNSCYFQKHDL